MNGLILHKLLFLTGDGGNDIGSPLPLVLPKSIVDKHDAISMTLTQFHTAITAQGRDYNWPLLRRNVISANPTYNMMQLAPVPSHLILDGFTKDLEAAEVLERIIGLENTEGEMFTHLKHFLLVCLSGHNIGDSHTLLSQEELLTPTPADARRWATRKFAVTFPTLIPAPTPTPALAQDPNIVALLAQLLPLRGPPARTIAEEKKDDSDDTTVMNMSQQEYVTTLVMCGAPADSPPTALPEWFQLSSEKGMTDSYRHTIINKHIMDNFRYDDAEVPLTHSVLKMVCKRNWTRKEGNVNRPSYVNANEGLSPFILLDLSEDEVAVINDEDDAFGTASHITVAQIKAIKTRSKATVPATQEKFMLLLKRYANLLFALFSGECTLFRCMVRVITALRAYSYNAREKMPPSMKASILWVILKQSRRFAIGEMGILQEFDEMHRCLASKLASFPHAETPSQLYEDTLNTDSNKRKTDINPAQPTDAKKHKPQLNSNGHNRNTWHPKLRQALTVPLKASGYPSYTAILKYCNTGTEDLYDRFHPKCGPNAFFGRCIRGMNCPKDHSLPSDDDVEKIMDMTKVFRLNPTGMHKG